MKPQRCIEEQKDPEEFDSLPPIPEDLVTTVPQQNDKTSIQGILSRPSTILHQLLNNDARIFSVASAEDQARPSLEYLPHLTYPSTHSLGSSESREEGETGPAQTAQTGHEQTQDRPRCYGPVLNLSDLDVLVT